MENLYRVAHGNTIYIYIYRIWLNFAKKKNSKSKSLRFFRKLIALYSENDIECFTKRRTLRGQCEDMLNAIATIFFKVPKC
jgi:hypothetical protein